MDVTTQKPFACRAKGCGMSFTNDDHLSVHEKKHEMSLNLELENKNSNIFVADQTPTPTRLIRNCEEVGLFDDLKHVNPFDETFRRAVESRSNTDVSGTGIPTNNSLVESTMLTSEDSLHTPQVFSNIEGSLNNDKKKEFKVEKEQVILSENIEYKRKHSIENILIKNVNMRKRRLFKKKTNKIYSDSDNVKREQVEKITVAAKPIIFPHTISIVQPQVITLSFPTANLMHSKPLLLPKPSENQNTLQSIPAKEKLKAILTNPRQTPATQDDTRIQMTKKSTKCSKLVYNDDCLERRRAAAMRYRRKIKKEQADLKKKNAELLAENVELKSIINQLQEVLDAHRNCDISSSLDANLQLDDTQLDKGPTIQIPPTTVKLVMNIPKLVIHSASKVPITPINVTNVQK